MLSTKWADLNRPRNLRTTEPTAASMSTGIEVDTYPILEADKTSIIRINGLLVLLSGLNLAINIEMGVLPLKLCQLPLKNYL